VELFLVRLGAGEVVERLRRLLEQVLAKPPTGTAEGWGRFSLMKRRDLTGEFNGRRGTICSKVVCLQLVVDLREECDNPMPTIAVHGLPPATPDSSSPPSTEA